VGRLQKIRVLKIDEPGVKPLKLADSDMVQPGDFVLAIGNPLGFDETVTDGIISSKGRPNRSDAFAELLQTNAAINPGNSGGPLINIRGEVIGINTAIASTTGGSQGLGFAIPRIQSTWRWKAYKSRDGYTRVSWYSDGTVAAWRRFGHGRCN
jgi:S1-C subfamily serine protease